MFPPSWHLSLTGRKHYALLFAGRMDRIQAETIHSLLGWLYDKQFHSHEDSPPSSPILQYFHSQILSYCNFVNTVSWQYMSCKIPWRTLSTKFQSYNTSVGLTLLQLLANHENVQHRQWNRPTKFKLKVNVKTQIALYRVCDFIMSSVQFMYSGFPIQSTSRVSIGWTEVTVSKSWRIYIHNPRLSLYTRNETRVHEFNKEIDLNNSVTISLEKTKSCSYKYSLNNTTQLCPCCLPWI
jgi:hypothetical protein